MYSIKKTIGIGTEFPDQDLIMDYGKCHYADMISYVALAAMSGEDVIEIGDSGITVQITYHEKLVGTQEGMKMLQSYGEDFSHIIEEAMPKMSERYQRFYQFFLNDKKVGRGKFPHF